MVYMTASVTANMVMSGQKLLYRRPTVSLRRPQAVKGASLHSHSPLISCSLTETDNSAVKDSASTAKDMRSGRREACQQLTERHQLRHHRP